MEFTRRIFRFRKPAHRAHDSRREIDAYSTPVGFGVFFYAFPLFVGVGHICHLLLAYIIVEVIVLMAGGDEHTGVMRRGDGMILASTMRERTITRFNTWSCLERLNGGRDT